MAERLKGEITIESMNKIIDTLPLLDHIYDKNHVVLIHGMGGQQRSFYRELQKNNNIELIWTDWIGKSWWSYIFSFIPGQAGLVKILDKKQLHSLYRKIGSLSMCCLYFVPASFVDSITEILKMKSETNLIEGLLKDEEDYFSLTVDFGYFSEDKNPLTYRSVVIGDQLSEELKNLLKII